MIEISPNQSLRQARDELDRLYLEYHMKHNGWRLGRVAKIAKMDRCWLYRLAHKLGVAIGYEKECAASVKRSAATVDDRSVTGGERPAPTGMPI